MMFLNMFRRNLKKSRELESAKLKITFFLIVLSFGTFFMDMDFPGLDPNFWPTQKKAMFQFSELGSESAKNPEIQIGSRKSGSMIKDIQKL